MMGRLHVTPTTVASNATAKPPMPIRIKMPRRSRLLNGTASALDLPRLANEPFPDVSVELVEVIVAASYFGGAEVLDRRVVLPSDVAEIRHGVLIGPGQSLVALRDGLGWADELAIEGEPVVEIERGGGHADAHVGLAVTSQHNFVRVLDFGSIVNECSALVVAPADELLIVFDVRLHVREQMRLFLKYSVEDLINQAAVFGFRGLVGRPSRVELAIELAIARVGVIEPVPLVGGENAEYDREHDQNPGKDILEADRVARSVATPVSRLAIDPGQRRREVATDSCFAPTRPVATARCRWWQRDSVRRPESRGGSTCKETRPRSMRAPCGGGFDGSHT